MKTIFLTTAIVPLAGRETTLVTLLLPVLPPTAWTLMVYCVLHWRLDKVALVAVLLSMHCVHHRMEHSFRLVVNSNTVNTCEQSLIWPLPQHSDICVVCSDFSIHWGWYICEWHVKCHKVAAYIYHIWAWDGWIQCPHLQEAHTLGCWSVCQVGLPQVTTTLM